MDIKRDLYLQQLIDRRHNGMIKVVTGVRRCGKSYLVFNLFNNYLKSNGVDDKHIIKERVLASHLGIAKEKDVVVIAPDG